MAGATHPGTRFVTKDRKPSLPGADARSDDAAQGNYMKQVMNRFAPRIAWMRRMLGDPLPVVCADTHMPCLPEGMRRPLHVAAGLLLAIGLSVSPFLATAAVQTAHTSATGTPAEVLAQVKAQVDHDPPAALRLGEAYWLAGPAARGDRFELGVLLMQAAEALHQDRKVVDIGERLDRARLDPVQRLKVMGYLTAHSWVTHDAHRLRALQGKLATLEKQLPAKREIIARLWRQLATQYYLVGDVDEAQRLARIAISKVPKHPDKVDYYAYQLIAIVDMKQGRMPAAIESLLAADHAGKALGLPDDPMFLQNFAGLFVYTKNWPKVIEYGQRALAAKPTEQVRVAVLSDIAAAHAEQGDLDDARALYQQALTVAQANHLPTAEILNNLGDMLQKHGRSDQALPLFREAVAAFDRKGDTADAAIAYSNLGAALSDLGQHQAAARAFDRSLALFKVSDDVDNRLELYPRMVDNLAALGRYREALSLMRTFKKTSDEHISVQSNTQIAKLESVIEVERQKRQLADAARSQAAQAMTLEKLQTREQRQRLLGYGMLIVILLLAMVAAIKIRESRVRRHLNQELERKNTEIHAQHEDLAKLNETIRRQSEEDALTGLRNRRFGQAWLERLAFRQLEAGRPGHGASVALLMLLDIDHFKRLNDTYGHEAGDHALMHFGDTLRECSRQSDVLVRWGGEEFLWICPDTPLSEAPELFARLREQGRRRPLILKGTEVALTVSMGFCAFPMWPEAAGDWALCLRLADTALYRAKARGRDRWIGFAPGHAPHESAAGDIAGLEACGALKQLDGAIDALTPMR